MHQLSKIDRLKQRAAELKQELRLVEAELKRACRRAHHRKKLKENKEPPAK